MAEGNDLKDIKKEIAKEKPPATITATPSGTQADSASAPGGPDEKAGKSDTSPGPFGLGMKLGDMVKGMEETGKPDSPNPGQSGAVQSTQTKPNASGQGTDDTKKQITEAVKKRVDSKFKDIEGNLKGLEKIAGLEEKISQLSQRLGSQVFQPPPQAQPAKDGGTTISRELASFGEEVDFQSELYETKRTIASIAKSLDTLGKKMEYRISILEDRAKVLERIPDLEDKFQDIRQRLGPENVQKLRKLIFSSDEIVDEVIPDLVNKKIRSKMDPALNELRDMQETINDFNSRLSHIKEEVLNLEKLRDDIQELRADKENLYKVLDEDSSRENEKLDLLRQSVRRKIESVIDDFKQQIRDIKKTQADSIKNDVNNSFLELIEPRFADLEKKQDILEDKAKRMSRTDLELDKKIAAIEAPENIMKWFEGKTDKMGRELGTEIASLQKKTFENESAIQKNLDGLKDFRTSMKDVPKRLGNQGNMINKLLDTKDFFVAKAESLAADTKNLSEKLSNLQANYSALEERMAGQESRFLEHLNKQRDYLADSREEMSRHLNAELEQMKKAADKSILAIRKEVERGARDQNRTALAEFKTEIKRLSSAEEEIKGLRRAQDLALGRLQKQVSDIEGGLKGALPEIRLLSSRLEEMGSAQATLANDLAQASDFHKASDSVVKSELMKYVDASLKALRHGLEGSFSDEKKVLLAGIKADLRRITDSEDAIRQLRKSQEEGYAILRDQIAGLRARDNDIALLASRLAEAETGIKGLASGLSGAVEERKKSDLALKEESRKYIDSSMKDLAKSMNSRLADASKDSIRQFKDEIRRIESLAKEMSAFRKVQESRTDELAEGLAGLSGPITDLKALSRKTGELEDIIVALDKRLDVEKDRKSEGLNSLENRINLMEKGLSDLGKTLAGLEKKVTQDNEGLQRALARVMSEKKTMDDEFASQRSKMSELIKELRSV